MKMFTVFCGCPTPLAANPFKVLAKNEQIAVERFFLRNGISGSDHPITVTEGGEVAESATTEDAPQVETDEDSEFITEVGFGEVDSPVNEIETVSEVVEQPTKSKSEAELIRDYVRDNPGATNKGVIVALKGEGVDITSSQVSAARRSLNEASNESSGDADGDQE